MSGKPKLNDDADLLSRSDGVRIVARNSRTIRSPLDEAGETSSLLLKQSGDDAISFDDALQMAKFGKLNVYLILMCGTIMATSIIEPLSISFVLPASECEMRFSTAQKGVLSGIGFAGIIASAYVWGFLSDTRGRRAVMVPSLLLGFLCTVLSSLAPDFYSLIFFRFLHGLFISGSSSAVYAYLGEFHTNAERSRAIMFGSVIFGMASTTMPLIAWAIINASWTFSIPLLGISYSPWRFFMVAIALPSLLSGLALLPVPESPKFVLSLGKQSETIAILQWMYRANGGRSGSMPNIERICEEDESIALRERRERYAGGGLSSVLRSMWSQTVPLFRGVYLRSTLISCFMQFGNYVNTNGMYMWFPDTVNRVIEYSQSNANASASVCEVLRWSACQEQLQDGATGNGTLESMLNDRCANAGTLESESFSYTFALEVMYAFGFALIALIIGRVGKLWVLVVMHVSFAACGFTVMFLSVPKVSLYMYLVILLIGLALPVLNAATIDLYPTSMRGMAVCLTGMMGRLGAVFGVNIVALLIENNCELTFGLVSGIMMLCGLLTFCIPGISSATAKEISADKLDAETKSEINVSTIEGTMQQTTPSKSPYPNLIQ